MREGGVTAWTSPGLRSSKHQKTPRGESTPRRPGTGVFWPGTRIRAARRSPASAGRRRGLEKRTEDTDGPGGGGKSGEWKRRCPGASVTREMQPRPKGARGTRPEPARLRPLRWWGRGAPRPRPRAHLVVSRPVHSLVTPRETGTCTHQEMPAGTPGAVLPARNTARGGRCPARGRGTRRAACPCGARRGPLPGAAGDTAGWLGRPPMHVAAERGRAQAGRGARSLAERLGAGLTLRPHDSNGWLPENGGTTRPHATSHPASAVTRDAQSGKPLRTLGTALARGGSGLCGPSRPRLCPAPPGGVEASGSRPGQARTLPTGPHGAPNPGDDHRPCDP